MKRSKSSKQWLKEHFDDVYVKRSKTMGYRSRAAYKLLQLQEKDKIISSAMRVVDLGAAPGSWSQVLAEIVGPKGHVYACDVLPMDALANVSFVQGDFREEQVLNNLLNLMEETKADAVLSDMAPNISGLKGVDQPRMMYLAELALAMTQQTLKPGGSFVVKLFQGAGFEEFLTTVKSEFKSVKIRKPTASRSRSQELYIVAQQYEASI